MAYALGAGQAYTAGLTQAFSIFVDLKDLVTTFTGTTSDIANIADNSLHVIAFTVADSGAPILSYNARLRFMG